MHTGIESEAPEVPLKAVVKLIDNKMQIKQTSGTPLPLIFFHKPKYPKPQKHLSKNFKGHKNYLNFQLLCIYELCFL